MIARQLVRAHSPCDVTRHDSHRAIRTTQMTPNTAATYQRYAIYYLCDPGPLADFGADWLGWDVIAGAARPHPSIPGFAGPVSGNTPADTADCPGPIHRLTETPRKYGFHGTIKPPFHLAPGQTGAQLLDAAQDLCATFPAFTADGLTLSRLGGFLALTLTDNTPKMSELAALCVKGLDRFRAEPDKKETARRRARGLTPRQDALLSRWGYPYVMEEFRFHMTLSKRMTDAKAAAAHTALLPHLSPLLPRPLVVHSLALVGSDDQGRFRLIRHLPLAKP